MGILDQFFKKPAERLVVDFQDNELVRFYAGYSLKKETILEVKPQQNVMIFSQGKDGHDPISSFIHEEGEYVIDKQTIKDEFVDILFLNTRQRVKRRWLSAYQPSDQLLEHPLTGEYSISIENGQTLLTFFEENYSNATSYDEFIDQWVSFSIYQVLVQNAVSAVDIVKKGDKLSAFLCQALQEDFKQYGLTLHKIKRTEIEMEIKPSPSLELSSKPEPIIVESDPPPLQDDQKKFYRVQYGQQIGPYSSREIQALIDQNELSPDELLWHKGLSVWKSANSFDIFIWD